MSVGGLVWYRKVQKTKVFKFSYSAVCIFGDS